MKTIKIHLRTLAFFLSALILLQGCTVYKSSLSTLDQAAKERTRVKIKTKDGKTLKFGQIILQEEEFYGISARKDILQKIRIDENDILYLQLKDRSSSTIVTLGAVTIGVGLILYLLVLSATERFVDDLTNL